MAHNPHHEHLISELKQMLKPLLSNSPQAIYVYLDDEHKFCNKKFADLLGYKSPSEWQKYQYPVSDVDEKDEKKAIKAYMEASEKMKAQSVKGTWVKKNGRKVKTQITMAPFTYGGEVFVIHYITKT